MRAARQFRALPRQVRTRLAPRIDGLAVEPRPAGARRLKAARPIHRLRVGDYRIVYEVRDATLVVLVVAVGHRRQVYRSMS